MKYPEILLLAFVFCAGVVPHTAQARIGESRESLERRLLSSGAVIYRDDVIEANRQRGMPYVQLLPLLEGKAEVRIYFKTDDGRRPQSSELDPKRMGQGWDLHVVYLRGVSVLEVYKRSHGINEFEFNELLARQVNGSFWKKVGRGDADESVVGYEMELEDGRLRAKRLGHDSLLVVDAKLDRMLYELKREDQQSNAPASVDGF